MSNLEPSFIFMGPYPVHVRFLFSPGSAWRSSNGLASKCLLLVCCLEIELAVPLPKWPLMLYSRQPVVTARLLRPSCNGGALSFGLSVAT